MTRTEVEDSVTTESDEPADCVAAEPTASTHPAADLQVEAAIPGAGTLIAETYRVVHELGRGGMGVVLLAWDTSLERHVAVKIVETAVASQAYRQGFLEEARSLARVRHPNVVTVHALGEIDARHGRRIPYYVMEYLPGGNLRAWVDAQGGAPVGLPLALNAVSQIAAGLTALWDVGLAHGDLKPANVLVGKDGRLVVTDVGLSFLHAPPGTFVGTPGYAAPELLVGRGPRRAMGKLADIYALGVVAYELFTGRKPFLDRTRSEMLSSHLLRSPPPPSSVSPDLPTSIDEPLLLALAKDPKKRPQTPDALVRELSEALSSASAFHGLRVVVADDDDDFRLLACAAIDAGLPGVAVEPACSGAEALEMVRGQSCDLLVTDLRMDGMDGFDLTRSVRAERGDRTRIVVATAVGGAPEWQRLSELGADAFLVKPLQPEDLVSVVRRLLGDARQPSK